MYSDELEDSAPQPKQPRVIILPGERRDIFTTSGLQKAAKVYESGEEPEGKLTTDRSRRLLESAGPCALHVGRDGALEPPNVDTFGTWKECPD